MISRQDAILDYITTYMRRNLRPPNTREISAAVGVSSPNGVQWHLRRLRAKGLIDWEFNKARTLRVLTRVTFPLRGTIDSKTGIITFNSRKGG